MDQDYTNYYHVDYLFKHMHYRDITDWNGLGLILWDVHEILMTKINLTCKELQLMKQVAAGYDTSDFTFEMRECYNSIIEKFIQHHS